MSDEDFGSNKRILVVDDSIVMRTQFRTELAAAGHEVDEAQDGASALRLLEEHVYDVALVDLNMPGMNGLQLVQELRKSSRHDDLFILMVSTETGADTVLQGRSLGVKGWVPKPVPMAQIMSAVRAAPQRAAAGAPASTGTD